MVAINQSCLLQVYCKACTRSSASVQQFVKSRLHDILAGNLCTNGHTIRPPQNTDNIGRHMIVKTKHPTIMCSKLNHERFGHHMKLCHNTCHMSHETVPSLTSDMGKKTVSVLAHSFLLPQRANLVYLLSIDPRRYSRSYL